MKRTILIAAILAATSAAHATERGYHQTVGSAPLSPHAVASGGAGGQGGAGGSGLGGSNTSRSWALGLGTSANIRTCLVPFLYVLNERDVSCDLREGGAPKASILIHCDRPDVRRALAASGELKCPEASTDDPYIRMRTQ